MKENEDFMYGLADRLIDEHIGTGKIETQSGYGPVFALLVIADLLGVPDEDRDEFRKHMTGLPTLDEAGEGGSVAHDPLSYLQDRFAEYVEDRRREPRRRRAHQARPGHLPRRLHPRHRHDLPHGHLRVRRRPGHHGPPDHRRACAPSATTPRSRPTSGPTSSASPTSSRRCSATTAWCAPPDAPRSGPPPSPASRSPPAPRSPSSPSAANRDPARFEAPDEFRPDRPNANEHLAFGRGIHACPGGPLSRIEARVAIERFLARTSDIQIDPEFHGPAGDRRWEFEPIYILHGLKALHLVLTPAEAAS